MKKIRIAIDGPAGAGKSTIAKLAAEKLQYTYVDTGAMYRALTYKSLQQQKNLADEQVLLDLLMDSRIELEPTPAGQQVFLDGQNVSEAIRTPEVTANVSEVAAHAAVRKEMVDRQMKLAESGGILMDGRDIGTHVIPDAELKLFMSASADERARRRFEDNKSRGLHIPVEELKQDILRRDKLDSEREASPLIQAEDAIFLDTTTLSIEDVVEKIVNLVKAKEQSG